jgi:hypothetical protein
MTLREAIVIAIECLCEHRPDDPRAKQAIKKLAAKGEVLRQRYETRFVKVDPEDFNSRPLANRGLDILIYFQGLECRCGFQKRTRTAFCDICYHRLIPSTKKSLSLRFRNGFEQAWEAACQELGKNPKLSIHTK